ncbi:MAG: hypothetical protein NC099_02265 [Corallococcus sp.]|nr:hypothetical protein [Corallococcus sp.]
MKKFTAILIAVMMAVTCLLLVACVDETKVVVRLHPNNGDPIRVYEYTESKGLPTSYTNGDKVFGGWYLDENLTQRFTEDTALDEGADLYAKWDNAGSIPSGNCVISVDTSKSFALAVGATVDFTQFFTIKDGDGNDVTVTNSMLDLSKVDMSKAGSFTVTVSYGGSSTSAQFTVSGSQVPATDLKAIFDKYKNEEWNFAVNVVSEEEDDYYEYYGDDVLYRYTYYGYDYTEYLTYGKDGTAYWYYEEDDGTYTVYSEDSEDFEEYFYMNLIDLSELSNYTFTAADGCYKAQNPNATGNAVLGEYEGHTWKSVTVYITNGNVSKIVGVQNDDYTFTFTFSKFGQVSFELPDATSSDPEYTVTLDTSKSLILEVGATVDYTQYFVITDKSGNNVTVTQSMLDTSAADTSKAGSFDVTISYEDASGKATFTVVAAGTDINTTPAELLTVFEKYSDVETWNFSVTITGDMEDYYEYLGSSVLNRYEAEDGETYTDYLAYDDGTDYFYYDNGDGTYTKYAEGTEDYEKCISYMYLIYLTKLNEHTFIKSGDCYVAKSPADAGNYVLGEFQYNFASLKIYVADGKISKIVGDFENGLTLTYTFGKHGQINFELPDATEGGGGEGEGDKPVTEPTGVMENQVYDSETFDNANLQDKLLEVDEAIGLKSTGTYNALVVPVQFKNGNTITDAQLANLNLAFNGTSAQTGWESVKTFYQKSSYGQLNITFDIQTVYKASNTASYYSKYQQKVQYSNSSGSWDKDGSALLLEEVLAYYESRLDLTKYDTNGDGCIDAVYLIYSEDVDYDNADFYWAYVTWYGGETTYDGLDAYYYLFAGFDFMKADPGTTMPDGMIINTETYIHETGHLLGLDDYYDYNTRQGSDQGLGGADMMDWNIGDHGVYSKMMLGWLDPEIVTSSKTVTIKSSQAGGYAILIPLDFDNTYFCEYLLIDLYSAQGLNAMHSESLYDGAEYGVRIYHVTSWAKNPYGTSYGSLTDYNNSTTNISLIKLVEADGKTSTSSTSYGGWASDMDLWQAGDKLSEAFPQYMRNDGKTLNFDITIKSVSAESATIEITYNSTAA